MRDYGPDVLASRPTRPGTRREVPVEPELVVETSDGFCGAVVGHDKTTVTLEDRVGACREFPLGPGFLIDGQAVVLVRRTPRPEQTGPSRQISASGSIAVTDHTAVVARSSRIWVEGVHDAELVERVWGHDLRVAGIVVEPLHGADDLSHAVRAFGPGPTRRLGVLLDHLVPGSKESRLAREVTSPHVHVVGHPFVDVWQAIRPDVVGLTSWPDVPPGQPWKAGVCAALGWDDDTGGAWRSLLARVHSYADLEPVLLRCVEELIDFVTEP
ncbi:MAG: DUF3097 family protein [Actinomycetes bacterium]